jgi:hypothetical protein
MRHTLLPLEERIKLRREYYRRVTIVFCFVLSLALMVGIAALFPTFVRSITLRTESQKAQKSIQTVVEDKNLKEIQKSVARSLALLDSLENDNNSPKISSLLNEVLNMKGNIKFTSFTASKVSTTTFVMSIQGFAPLRSDILSFKSNFEKLLPGNKIDLPVSELAKSSNFQFSLQLKQKIQ